MTGGDPGADPGAEYLRREAEHTAEVERARRASLRIGTVRVVTFLAAGAALVLADPWTGAAERAAQAVAFVLGVAFLFEISVHRRVRRRQRWHETLRGLAREGTLRLTRNWSELDQALPASERGDTTAEGPRRPTERRHSQSDHPSARDLDILGQASLLRLLGPVTSERGRATLRGWLLDPFEPQASSERQAGVRELAPEVELREAVAAHGRLNTPEDAGALEPFLAWAETPPWLPGWAHVSAWMLPATLVLLVVGQVVLGWPPFWIVPALAQIVVLRRLRSRVHEELGMVEASGASLDAYVAQIEQVESGQWTAPYLLRIREALGGQATPASGELRRLARWVDTLSSRDNLVYAMAAPVLLLDLHLGVALDGWRRRSGAAARGWLDALGRWEALSALATAAHDHPDWCFPTFAAANAGPPVVRARALGHPLLVPAACVRNDVEVGPPGGFLLVTGSNMSGKSTLLRAIGANVVLAGAGGPACAASLEVPHVRVRTTMRVEDSVTQGVSLFMAELLRIRDVIAAVDETAEEGPPVLYLLDEILHGTNTAERQVAARAVIRHLVASGAIGAVSTHDLTLAESPELQASAVAVHFREDVEPGENGRPRLTFDYLLRPGLATTRNALKLLDAVGLGGLEGLE